MPDGLRQKREYRDGENSQYRPRSEYDVIRHDTQRSPMCPIDALLIAARIKREAEIIRVAERPGEHRHDDRRHGV